MTDYETATIALAGPSVFDEPPAAPLQTLRDWIDEAERLRVPEPHAMALATADREGRSSIRMVHVIDFRDGGLIFTSHRDSQKGLEIAATGWASGVLYWRETKRQIAVAGPAKALPAEMADVLWARRPVSTHAMSVASTQSAPLDDEDALRDRAQALAASALPLPRPEGWVAYVLRPVSVEFWQASPDRLHRRLRYDANGAAWKVRRLQP